VNSNPDPPTGGEGSPTTEHIIHALKASIMEILRFIKYHDKNNEQHGKF